MSRRPSDTPSIGSNSKLKTRANSRRVSLITGEALEQAHAALALAQQSGECAPVLPSAIVAAATLQAQESQLSLSDGGSRRPSVSLYHPPPPFNDHDNGKSTADKGDDKDGIRVDDDKVEDRRPRRKSTMREESVSGALEGSVTSPQR